MHRDVKPENVLVGDDGRIRVADFGLSRATTSHTSGGKALVGTVAYLSPELVSGEEADARSDVYAAGIMLFELLTGEPPFTGTRRWRSHTSTCTRIPRGRRTSGRRSHANSIPSS